MPSNKESIMSTEAQVIVQNAALKAAVEAVDPSLKVVYLDGNARIHDLEEFQPLKRRMTGHFATTSFLALAQFAQSTIDSSLKTENPSCFIGNNGNAKLIFNYGDIGNPLHQDLSASIQLNTTPVFDAISRLKDSRLSQRELAEFIEDFNDYVTALDASGNEINLNVAIGAIRNMTIESNKSVNQESTDFKDTSSAFASVEAKFKDATPAYLSFDIPAFNEIDNRTFIFRISVITSDEKIKLALRCPKWDEVIESINIEFQEKLTKDLKPLSVKTFIGNWA